MIGGDRFKADDPADTLQQPVMAAKPALPVARCADCLYWGVGQCRRGPPDLHRFGARLSAFPLTDGDVDWCGEFVHKTLGSWWSGDKHARRWRFPTEPE